MNIQTTDVLFCYGDASGTANIVINGGTPPYEINQGNINNLNQIESKKIRVGGMVKKNSIEIENKNLKFVITDFKNEIIVTFSGSVPNLFEEGKGVVAEGYLEDRKYLKAEKILAKHDENYMPPEVKEAMQGN